LQNALPGVIGRPQLTQNFDAGLAGCDCGAPQELQKRTPSGMGAPQRLQVVLICSAYATAEFLNAAFHSVGLQVNEIF
jgi:hypothetical protein